MHVRIEIPPVPRFLEAVAEGLVLLNVELLRYAEEEGGLELPSLYESGVVYRREPRGREWWETATDLRGVISNRSGDCEDLAAARAAECRYYDGDEGACVRIMRTPRGSFHAVVQHGDGSIEDPSRILLDIERRKRGR